MTYQLVPPNDHRCNLAENSIQTWKDHLIGVMRGILESFPAHLWCQATPKAEWHLLLLRKSNVNPKISTYDDVYSPHDYNAAHFLPIGMETLVHNKPKRRVTFAEHCSKGFVLGTAFEHYHSWIMWMKDTRATLILAAVFHKHKYITNPDITPESRVIAAAGNLSDTIKGCMPPHLSETILEKLKRIRIILKHEQTQTFHTNTLRIPPNPPPTPPTDPHRLHPIKSCTHTCTTENTLDIVNSATSKGGDTSKGATTNSGATSKGGDTPDSGSPSHTETFTPTGVPT